MNKYSEIFEVNKQMHLRPIGKMVESMSRYKKDYLGLDFKLLFKPHDYELDYSGILGLLNHPLALVRGSLIEISAFGEYDSKLLQSIVREVGSFLTDSEKVGKSLEEKLKE